MASRLITPASEARPSRSTTRARGTLSLSLENCSAVTKSPSSAAPKSRSATRYSTRFRRSAGVILPPSRLRRKTPAIRVLATPSTRMILASISPLSREINCAAARAPVGNGSTMLASTTRTFGAGSGPCHAIGRTSGTPSSSLPKRSTMATLGVNGGADKDRLPLPRTDPEFGIEGNRPKLRLTAFLLDLAI
jgi:hypothetical protein